MSPRRARGASSQNLDSLLDTMANVVGILVVLMAVTQLTVNEAFDRIRISEREHVRELDAQREEAEQALAEIDEASQKQKREIAQMRAQLDRLRKDPDAARIADEATAATQLASQTLQVRRLEKQVDVKKVKLEDLRIHLSEYESIPEPAATELRLPDPRPAPPTASPVVFFCRYGRVMYPDLDRLLEDLVEVSRRARGMSSAYFRDHDVGSRDFRWQVASGGLARLDWRRPTAGETLDEFKREDSSVKEAIARYDPNRYFIQFYVWGDSFETYLEARRYVESQGYSVGWEVWQVGQSLKFGQSLTRAPTPVD